MNWEVNLVKQNPRTAVVLSIALITGAAFNIPIQGYQQSWPRIDFISRHIHHQPAVYFVQNIMNVCSASGWHLIVCNGGREDSLPHSSPTSNNISAHVLDISIGQPARGVNCTTYKHKKDDQWVELGTTTTDAKGRIGVVHPNISLSAGIYKLRFATQPYFHMRQQSTFYPFIEVVFAVEDITQHYHIPITLTNFGYSTYKGQ